MKRKYHQGISVAADLYKVDLEVADRYIAFSAETLRIASLGLAGYGFLITNILLRTSSEQGPTALAQVVAQNKYLLALGAVFLGLSVASALAHRYYATECLTHFVRGIRLSGDQAITNDRDEEEDSLSRDVTMTKWTLRSAATLLAAGAGCIAWALAAALSSLQ